MTKNGLNRTTTVQAPEYVENIGQCVRYIIEIERGYFPNNIRSVCPKWIESGQYFT